MVHGARLKVVPNDKVLLPHPIKFRRLSFSETNEHYLSIKRIFIDICSPQGFVYRNTV